MEWAEFVLLLGSVLAIAIIIYIILTALGIIH